MPTRHGRASNWTASGTEDVTSDFWQIREAIPRLPLQHPLRTVCQNCSPLRVSFLCCWDLNSWRQCPARPVGARADIKLRKALWLHADIRPRHKNRTPAKAAAKERMRGQEPGAVGSASLAPLRPGAGRECVRDSRTRTPRPQEHRCRRCGIERVTSPAPLFVRPFQRRT